MTVTGIDVANYQSADYDTTGLGFVIVKATEGTTYVNPKHAAQVTTGRAHGLVVGHYHFVRPGSMSAQVSYFLQHAAPKAGDFIALDWEDAKVSNGDKDTWLTSAQKAAPDLRSLLYCNRDFWLNRDKTSLCGDGLWIADPSAPTGHPRVEHAWTMHQYSSAGGVDHNVANFASTAALQTWVLNGAKTPATAPKYEPFPGAAWFALGHRSPIVAAMHQRLVAQGCGHYRTTTNADLIGSGDVNSYEAWQRKYNTAHHKSWTGNALKWPPGKETWDALQVPNV